MAKVLKIMNKKIKTILALILVAIFGGVFMSGTFSTKRADAAWYASGGTWGYRQQITIDHNKVAANQGSSSIGPNNPGTAASDASVGTLSWSNFNNIMTSNDSRATVTVTSNNITHYLKATNFGFNVPAGAIIQGITVGIERGRSGGSSGNIRDNEVKLVKSDGSIGSTNKASTTNWVTGESYFSYGGPADLWGESWTAADINDPDFGAVLSVVGVSSNNRVASVDHVRITVTYFFTGHPNFPMLVSSTVADWKQTAYGGHVALSTGNDILFTAGDGTTKLDHEIERYVPTTGELVAWIRIPSLSADVDTPIYMYYGNAAAADQSNPTGVWSGYAGVWHMSDSSGTTITESTSNPNEGQKLSVNEPVYVSGGKIGGAQDYDGYDDAVSVDVHSSLDALTDITISAWIKPDAWSNPWGDAIVNKDGNYFLRIDEFASELHLGWWDGVNSIVVVGSPLPSTGSWHYVVGVVQNNDPYRIYINSISSAGSPWVWVTDFGGKWFLEPLIIGGSGDPSFDGYIDEVRVIIAARSAEWIATEYANQSAPNSFYSIGGLDIETNPGTPAVRARSGSYGPEPPAVRVRGGVKFR